MTQPNTSTAATGWGLATEHASGLTLDVWYPEPALGAGGSEPPPTLVALATEDTARQTRTTVVRTEVDLATGPVNAADAYLRLHLLSHRLMPPNSMNLDGIFGVLSNVVWTNFGPCAADGFETTRAQLRSRGPVTVYGVDKFPRMTDYVVPTGVRIADADRVRLGAHLAEGTTVMHEGFVNYNAGTLGSSMIEGRISQGVIIGAGSDVGGGASTMGTLSGGGSERVSIGERCLIGANAGIGIALGDDCVVEAGLYITAGTKIISGEQIVKARQLSGRSGLLFLRNSLTGSVEVRDRKGGAVELNAALHTN